MSYPAEILLAALGLVFASCIGAMAYVRFVGFSKRSLARLDFISFLAGSGGLLSLVPETVRMFAPNLMANEPTVWLVVDRFKYLAFFLVSVSIGLGATRRWYTIKIEK